MSLDKFIPTKAQIQHDVCGGRLDDKNFTTGKNELNLRFCNKLLSIVHPNQCKTCKDPAWFTPTMAKAEWKKGSGK